MDEMTHSCMVDGACIGAGRYEAWRCTAVRCSAYAMVGRVVVAAYGRDMSQGGGSGGSTLGKVDREESVRVDAICRYVPYVYKQL